LPICGICVTTVRCHTKLGRFKPLSDFDWAWPEFIDRKLVDELMGLRFTGEGAKVILVGPNGVGKTLLPKNLAHQALLNGHTVSFTRRRFRWHDSDE
jgi:DNA replication protein DnaC